MTDEQGGEIHGSFNAPVAPDSKLPPLLGLRSLMAKSAVLDMGTKRLIIPGDGGLRVQASPGTIVLPLQVSESGHLILEWTPGCSFVMRRAGDHPTIWCSAWDAGKPGQRCRSRSAGRRDRREASPSVEEPEREG